MISLVSPGSLGISHECDEMNECMDGLGIMDYVTFLIPLMRSGHSTLKDLNMIFRRFRLLNIVGGFSVMISNLHGSEQDKRK